MLSPWRECQGFLGALCTCTFLCHPALHRACTYARGQGSSPCEGSCSTLQYSLSFGGWYTALLTQHVPLPGVKHESIPCQALSDDSFASATASPLQLQELPQALINLCGCLLCCWGERSATVVYHFTPHSFATSQSSAPTVKLLCDRAACCMNTCSVLQYLAAAAPQIRSMSSGCELMTNLMAFIFLHCFSGTLQVEDLNQSAGLDLHRCSEKL